MNWKRLRSRYRQECLPQEKYSQRKEGVGMEVEMPVINLDREAVDFTVIHRITGCFMKHFQFQEAGRDE